MDMTPPPAPGPRSVAVVGAGLAGSTLVRALLDEGIDVHLFDKSRGPGGRLATRRAAWCDARGQARVTAFDHGAPWFSATDPPFRAAVEQAVRDGLVTTWRPRLHPQSLEPSESAEVVFLPAPTMTRWCKQLAGEARVHWESPVEVLRRSDGGWQLEGHDGLQDRVFDAVLLALPPAQAATLLAPHQREWAQRASLMPMQPCWTLMGVTDPLPGWRSWDAARPAPGALGLVLRNDGRPGREERRDEAHWVVHAKPGWSRTHLEDDAAWVQQALQDALGEWLRVTLRWRHALAHRWRYAQPHTGHHALRPGAWWDEGLRLGVCGDFLGGAAGGVEAAWCSAQALAKRVLQRDPDEPEVAAEEDHEDSAAAAVPAPVPAQALP